MCGNDGDKLDTHIRLCHVVKRWQPQGAEMMEVFPAVSTRVVSTRTSNEVMEEAK